ncbi:hypothetical protein HDU76_005372 [Blyttiomyces sp. JEL0837]|nr:hypothetical protein HDU76_005372 [Blyttiomyces sp. JEL0837]
MLLSNFQLLRRELVNNNGDINNRSIIVKTLYENIAVSSNISIENVSDLMNALWEENYAPQNVQAASNRMSTDAEVGQAVESPAPNNDLPLFIAPEHKVCPACNGNLKIQSGKKVNVITNDGIKEGVYFLKSCRKEKDKNCMLAHVDVDRSVFNDMVDKHRVVYNSKQDIISSGYLRINQSWYITWTAAELWCVNMASVLASKHWNLQLAYRAHFGSTKLNLPTPKSSQIFQKVYILYNLISHSHYLSNVRSIAGMNHRSDGHLRLTVPKMDGYKFNDLHSAMDEYVRWFEQYGHQKWALLHRENCKCTQIVNGFNVAGIVMDGKVMGHQVCRIKHCRFPIINARVGLCQSHYEEYDGKCLIMGCNEPVSHDVITGYGSCVNDIHRAAVAKAVEAAFNKNQKNRNLAKPPLNSVSHERDAVQAAEQLSLKYPLLARFLPCLFAASRSCGKILFLQKFFTFEGNEDLIPFVKIIVDCVHSQKDSNNLTVIYYDRACKLYQTLENDPQTKHLLGKVAFLVDLFHFRGHNDTYCREKCNPITAGVEFEKAGMEKFNTSAAEQVNVWFGRISHMLRYIDPKLHDFYLYSLVDYRNRVDVGDEDEENGRNEITKLMKI